MINIRLIPLFITIAFTLQACGGGSDSSNDTVIDDPTTPTETTDTTDKDDDKTDTSDPTDKDDDKTDTTTPTTPTPTNDTVEVFEADSLIRISDNEGGMIANLASGDRFSRDHDNAGDIDGDGISDLIVGARSDDDGATDAGAVYILFMNADGTVKSNQKISATQGGFVGNLVASNFFGYGVAGIGDYNGDSIPDIAVSAPAAGAPAIYILHLNTDGTVKSQVKNSNIIAQGLSAVGDLNNDGKIDLAAADPNGGSGGQVHLMFFDQSSQLIQDDTVTIGEGLNGFGSGIFAGDSFGGRESALLGDIDNNGTLELAVGSFQADNGIGAIWILSLNKDTLQVVDKLKIAPGSNGFDETISTDVNANGTTGGHFGHALIAAGDLNGDNVPDLITSANQYNDGVAYILYLNSDKTVKTFTRINSDEGGFDLTLGTIERFGRSISIVDDNRADGKITVNIGGGAGDNSNGGAFYAMDFQTCSYTEYDEDMFWSGGNILYTNWDHASQTVSTPLSFEQCSLKASETQGFRMTAKESDGRCIIKDSSSALEFSEEGSSAYVRSCP